MRLIKCLVIIKGQEMIRPRLLTLLRFFID